MTSVELVERVARQTGVSPGLVRTVLSSAFGSIGDALQLGQAVALADFGVFRASRRATSGQIVFTASPQLLGRITPR